jgi:hypothetical protein
MHFLNEILAAAGRLRVEPCVPHVAHASTSPAYARGRAWSPVRPCRRYRRTSCYRTPTGRGHSRQRTHAQVSLFFFLLSVVILGKGVGIGLLVGRSVGRVGRERAGTRPGSCTRACVRSEGRVLVIDRSLETWIEQETDLRAGSLGSARSSTKVCFL